MYKPRDNSVSGGPARGDDGNTPRPGTVRLRPGSVVRGTPTPAPIALEASSSPSRLIPGNAEPIPTELLHLWMGLTRREQWSSLVVVPAQPGASGLEVGRAIVSVGSQYREKPLRLIDAEGLPPGAALRLVRDMRSHVAQGELVVACIDSVLTHPVGLEVALAAERALLCVTLGSTQLSAARHTLERIGQERFLGSVTLRHGARAPTIQQAAVKRTSAPYT